MEKNGIYEGLVSGIGTEGEGIINYQGTTAFVPFCLVGERVEFKALKVKGNIAYGKLLRVLEKSPQRVEPPCPVFGKCGGCDLQHMSYLSQLEFKRKTVSAALEKIGNISFDVDECVPCEKQLRYRNKLALPIGEDGDGVCLGFYGGHSHRIVKTDDCLIQSEWVRTVIKEVENFAKVRHIAGYNEETGRGILRRIVVREVCGKFIFALVVAKKTDVSPLVDALSEKFENFTFLLNINASPTNAIFGKEWHICHGNGVLEGEEGGIKFSAGANTFLQVNDGVREKLYSAVLAAADAEDTVADLYSGGGMLTAMFAKKCKAAYGVEIVAEASRCADELKELNGLKNMHNICGAVEDKLGEVLAKTAKGRRVIVCDPPRKGMARSVVNAIRQVDAEKIVLISCNPATLARDLGLLLGTLEERDGNIVKSDISPAQPQKYTLKSVTPYDMFPQTKWCETLVLLSKKI